MILRLYEAHGTRAAATITADFDTTGAIQTDLLERPLEGAGQKLAAILTADGAASRLVLNPFQLVTLRYRR